MKPFRGVGAALVTLFSDDGALDVAATAGHAARLVDAGLQALVVAGTTGEAETLTRDERRTLLAAVRDVAGDGVAVVAGTGADDTDEAAALTADAVDGGADAVLARSPAGVADPRPYYAAVAAAAGDVAVLAYHYPQVAPPGIGLELLRDLPVVGLKDSSGDAERLIAEVAGSGLAVYTGAAPLLALAGPIGCAGAILALANLDPTGCLAAFTGDGKAQVALLEGHRATQHAAPAGLKAAMGQRYGTSTAVRRR